MPKGLIIYFDGPDGVGKTTQLKLAEKALQDRGLRAQAEHTLGGTPIGDRLREIIFSDLERPAETNMHIALAIQYAFIPELLRLREEGRIVLVDRSPLSIVAYQVFGDGLAERKGVEGARELLEAIRPDLIILYEAGNADLASRRQEQNRHKATDHFNKKPPGYHQRVARGYKTVAKAFDVKVVDASRSVEAIHADTMASIMAVLQA